MEKIKVGDFIRIKHNGIKKVEHINYEKCEIEHRRGVVIFDDLEDMENYIKNDITKHSPNIIDLIEVGDYVNGELVASVDEKSVEIGEGWHVKPEDIKSIVTHEQFNSIKYEVI